MSAAAMLVTFFIIAGSIPAAAVTWSDSETRLTTYPDFDGVPCITQTNDGSLWIFWTRRVGRAYDLLYMISPNQGATWSQETQLTTDESADVGVSAYQTSDGSLWTVWASDRTGNYDLYYKISSDLGASWSEATQLTSHPASDLKPAVRQMSDGQIWVVWASSRSGSYDLYRKTSFDNGISWSDETRLTTDSSLDKMPSLAQMSDGSIWLVWASDRTGNYDLYYKISSDLGASWSEATQLTSSSAIDSNPSILQTIDGRIWIFYSLRKASATATDDIYYMYSADNGVTWSDNVQFTTDKYDDIWPSVAQTRLGRVWVVWVSDRADQPDWGNLDIYCRASLAGDINEDNKVDIRDLTIVARSFGCFEGEPGYDPAADVNGDGIVEMRDLRIVAYYLGKT